MPRVNGGCYCGSVKHRKYRTIIITGGTVSGIGKGITAASLGRLLQNRGFSVSPVKADPYLNEDAGTMNPYQHGEVFVTEDGAETDLDLGHYERFLNVNVNRFANFTSGAVYRSVMEHEREGEYLGKTIQIIPHVTNEIKRRVEQAAASAKPDFLTVEIGGTVGDIEALPFIEALRQFREEDRERTAVVHVVKMDYIYPSDEAKTKPIQHSVIALRGYGLQPDVLVVRCKRPLEDGEKEKLAMFTGVPRERIIAAADAPSLYAIPEAMEAEGFADAILGHFRMRAKHQPNGAAERWRTMRENEQNVRGVVRIGLVGKYVQNPDAYISVIEAVRHAAMFHRVKAEIVPIDSEGDVARQLKRVDALVVPGGFGGRGIEGKVAAVRHARKHGLPFLGLCLGLQMAVIEYARSEAGLKAATSLEFDEGTACAVVTFLPGQESILRKGGTMRLGSYTARLKPGSLALKLYKQYRPEEVHDHCITERHRHRYEVNPEYHEVLERAGLVISGVLPERELVEFIELPLSVHPFFIATQAHPEFRSRPELPHPLFAGLVGAGKKRAG